MVAGVGRVDRDDRQITQILALFLAQGQFGGGLCPCQSFFGEAVRNTVFVDRDQAVALRRERIAKHFGNLDARTGTTPNRLGQHEITFLRPANIGDARGIADALVDGREPCRTAIVQLDHAQQRLLAVGQFLHRVREPALTRLFRARQHPVALAQGGLFLLFDHPQAWRRHGVIGLPAIGNRDRFAILDIDHAQHGDFRNAAHAVKRRLATVNQAFLGHVLEQLLERDLFLPLDTEMLADLALADLPVGRTDKFEDLLATGQTGWRTLAHSLVSSG